MISPFSGPLGGLSQQKITEVDNSFRRGSLLVLFGSTILFGLGLFFDIGVFEVLAPGAMVVSAFLAAVAQWFISSDAALSQTRKGNDDGER